VTVPRREGSNARCHTTSPQSNRDPDQGSVPRDADQRCPRCGGEGKLRAPFDPTLITGYCPNCAGRLTRANVPTPTHETLIGTALIGTALDMGWLEPRTHTVDLPNVLASMGPLDLDRDTAVEHAMRVTESLGPIMDPLLMRLTYTNAYDELARRLAS
jgi:hypothetical protein